MAAAQLINFILLFFIVSGYADVRKADWQSPADIKNIYRNASILLDFVQFCYWGLGIMDAKAGSDRVSITAKSVLYQ